MMFPVEHHKTSFAFWLASQQGRMDAVANVGGFVATDPDAPKTNDWPTWENYLISVRATESELNLVRMAWERWELTRPKLFGV